MIDPENRKVLYLSYDGLSDPLGQSQIVPYLNGLADRGWKFWVISFEKTKKDIHLHKNIFWIAKRYHSDPPVISTIYDLLILHRTSSELVVENNIRIVHCRGYITSIVGHKLKDKYGLKFIFDMRGFWPDEKIESGNWASPIYSPVYKYFKDKEVLFFRNADIIISLTLKGKYYLIERHGIVEENVEVIPTCVDFRLFKRSGTKERSSIRKYLGIARKEHVFVYSGSLGGNYPIDLLLDFYQSLSCKFKFSRLLVLSFENHLINMNHEVISLKVEREKIPGYLSASDTGLIIYKSGFSNMGRCPTKYAEYLACGLDVRFPENYGDLGEYKESTFKKYFSLDNGIEKYEDTYRSLLTG